MALKPDKWRPDKFYTEVTGEVRQPASIMNDLRVVLLHAPTCLRRDLFCTSEFAVCGHPGDPRKTHRVGEMDGNTYESRGSITLR